ncbi:MAG TPA: galactose oxidase, partial [Thermoanaerobaculia bacterium]|nr:galactose oxidase [Thermoanaerobaculia bacterium]
SVDLNSGGQYDPGADSWTATTTTGGPTERRLHAAVWTGSRMIVWGGVAGQAPPFTISNTGGQYGTLSLYVKN